MTRLPEYVIITVQKDKEHKENNMKRLTLKQFIADYKKMKLSKTTKLKQIHEQSFDIENLTPKQLDKLVNKINKDISCHINFGHDDNKTWLSVWGY